MVFTSVKPEQEQNGMNVYISESIICTFNLSVSIVMYVQIVLTAVSTPSMPKQILNIDSDSSSRNMEGIGQWRVCCFSLYGEFSVTGGIDSEKTTTQQGHQDTECTQLMLPSVS